MSGPAGVPPALAVHGGAGAARRLDPQDEAGRRDALARSLRAGHALLLAGAPALEAVEAAVRVLEDHPGFNAGLGSVLTSAGRVEMDACVADGATRRFGAVAAVSRLANPVSAARAVMEDGRHVLLVGEGAERFAFGAGLPAVASESLATDLRRAQLARAARAGRTALDHDASGPDAVEPEEPAPPEAEPGAQGTVGAVARDAAGRLAAATSTGGMTNQHPGRVGDSPVPGAGTWADADCAVSGTGTGEAFLRVAFAHQVAARVRFTGAGLQEACRDALAEVAALGGRGGCIAVACQGEPVLCFDTTAMFRGAVGADGEARVALYAEPLAACRS